LSDKREQVIQLCSLGILFFKGHDMNELKKTLGLPLLVFYGTGMILGAGIYTIIGAAAGSAHDAVWMSFLLGAFISLLTGFSYAELATMFPRSGAEYHYLREAFPQRPIWAAGVGWLVAVGLATTATTVSVAFAGYLQHFISIPTSVVAAGLILLFTLVNILGIEESSWTNVVFTLIEAVGLTLFISLGIKGANMGTPLNALPHAGVFPATALVIFSFFGFENIVNLAEEAKNPAKNIPKAIFWSLGISTFLYFLVSLAAVSLLPAELLANSSRPLAEAAESQSTWVAGVLSGIALFSTANTALIALLVTSRIFYGMAKGGDLPEFLAMTHVKRRTPWIASLGAFFLAVVFLPLGEVAALANLSSLSTLVSFVGVSIALIVLRYRRPEMVRPYRVPFSIGKFPVLTGLAILTTLGLMTQFDMMTFALGGILFAFFILSYLSWKFYLTKTKLSPLYVNHLEME
jgi:basic amino acid/polyamine antiporter, APA family